MNTTRLVAISCAAVSLAAAAPASHALAQAYQGATVDTTATVAGQGNWTLKERENWLQDRLHTARDDGSIDGHEYDRVNHELDRIRDSENDLRGQHDGGQLTDNETSMLEARLDGVADQIHWLHEDRFRKPW
jgi:hypothetical protein